VQFNQALKKLYFFLSLFCVSPW